VIWATLLAIQQWDNPVRLCEIEDKRVSESSGIAPSHMVPNAYYTHNDSGDSARFFRFDQSGRITGVFTLRGVKAIDWEDMASRVLNGRSHLYIGDIGDNAKGRAEILIYRFTEPTGGSRDVTSFDTIRARYPDGPQDCEALIVDPKSGDIYFVTKSRTPESIVYRMAAPARSGTYDLERLGVLKINTGGLGGQMITAGDAAPNGRAVILRTYSGALEFAAPVKFRDWWKSTPRAVPVGGSIQSEAICYSRDSRRVLTTSEGSPCPVFATSRENSD